MSIDGTTLGPETLDNLLTISPTDDVITGRIRQATAAALAISLLALYLGMLPGHRDFGWWPLYVPEHYGPRNSQHLLDPYR